MHDPAYKLLFARPRMVRDLLDGFAARGWSGALDFDTLAPLPASFVSEDLQQRHGDLVWRIRFRDDRWLYLVLLLEFQATVDRGMALRMLTYTALLYQRLDADGVLRGHGALPPVLPVVLYNGRRPWTAPVEMTALVAAGSDLLAPYQPSQRYYLFGRGACGRRGPAGGQPGVGGHRTGEDARRGASARGAAGADRPSAGAGGRPLDPGVRDVAAPGAAVRGPAPGRARGTR